MDWLSLLSAFLFLTPVGYIILIGIGYLLGLIDPDRFGL
jgi:hypothetical protein